MFDLLSPCFFLPALRSAILCSAAGFLLLTEILLTRQLINSSPFFPNCSLNVHCQRNTHFLPRCFTLKALQWLNRFNVNIYRKLVLLTVA